MASRKSLLLLLALGALACRVERSVTPAGLASARPVLLAPERRWQVLRGDELVGIVLRFCAKQRGDSAGRQYYSVRNGLHQELGTIDGLGRAWRFEPHESEPRWVATGTLAEGVRAILGESAALTLVELHEPTSSASEARDS